jgi:hypothetical protein
MSSFWIGGDKYEALLALLTNIELTTGSVDEAHFKISIKLPRLLDLIINRRYNNRIADAILERRSLFFQINSTRSLSRTSTTVVSVLVRKTNCW